MPDLTPELSLKEYWEKREDIESFRKGIIVDHSHNLVSICIQINGDKQWPRGILFDFHTQEDLRKGHMADIGPNINGMVQVNDTMYNCGGVGSSELLLDNPASAGSSEPFGG